MKKLIYLEDAVNEIARWIGYLDKDMISRIQIGLERLPSSQPEIEERMSETEQNVPNDDFISRKGAIDAIEAVFPIDPMKSEYAQGIACGAALSKTYIEQLPSAQPERKKGKWLLVEESIKVAAYKCSECGRNVWNDMGYDVVKDYPFCHCGADMRGEKG